MENCKKCNVEIPDGSMYCEECQEKEQLKSKESYLDGLLSSVIGNSEPNKQSKMESKKSENEESNLEFHNEPSEESVVDEYLQDFRMDSESDDLQDFDQFDFMDDLDASEEFMELEHQNERKDNIEISEEDLFGPSLGTTAVEATIDNRQDNDNVIPNEIDRFEENDFEDPALYDILNELEMADIEGEEDNRIEDIHLPAQEEQIDDPEEQIDDPEEDTIDEDILSLLNQMSIDDPVAAGITNLINGTDGLEQDASDTRPSDVGEVFSDALTAVSSLKDKDSNAEQSNLKGTMAERKKLKNEKLKKLMVQSESEKETKAKKRKRKNGLFSKIFAKSTDDKLEKKDEKTASASAEDTSMVDDKEEKKAKKSVKIANKSKKAKKTKKAKKKAVALLAKQGEANDNIETNDDKKIGKKVNKKETVKEKKAAKKKTKQVKRVVDEIEIDQGKINPVAASIVMVTFALLAVLLLSGTKAFAYSNSIKNATYYFNTNLYTKAYDEVHGMEIRDEDVEIFNKIQTVMYVNKQLNSYNNYNAVAKHPEALDSLLKGLKRYEKYIELATMYGIKSDLDYVREQILAELNREYNLSEDVAMQMIVIENESEYSKLVYDAIIEK